jgi:molybdate transport system substrate-binding protein
VERAVRRLAAALLCLALGPAFAGDVLVFAAASLRESLDANLRAFEAATGYKASASYAASNALARQIENGAPADLFISADLDWVDHVERRGFVLAGSRHDLLGNDLVLIAPAASNVRLKLARGVDIATALGGKRIALADPDTVPAGKYAKAALIWLGAWKAIEGRIAAADNVRAALALVARGEAPLGVVYRSDAVAEAKVRVVDAFPDGSHAPIVYPIVVLKRSKTPAAAALEAFLGSSAAMATFKRFGFRTP